MKLNMIPSLKRTTNKRLIQVSFKIYPAFLTILHLLADR